MKFAQVLTVFAFAAQTINAASIPDSSDVLTSDALTVRDAPFAPDHTLERRKGGGGRGGGGGGGSGGGGVSRSSPQSASGGSTRSGSGPSRSYGGGKYYGGGATVPYSSGGRSPRGLAPGLLIAPVLVLAIMPGIWLYSVYPYYYNNPYRFYNASRNITRREEPNTSLPVLCLCQEFQVCGCDENDDQSYLNDLVGDGNYAALNKTLVTVSNINGTDTLVLNGSLPNGTTAPGGTDDEGAAINLAIGKYMGYWAMGLIVLYGVLL